MLECSAKISFGENSHGEISVRRKFRFAKILFGENSFGEISVSENSSHAFEWFQFTMCLHNHTRCRKSDIKLSKFIELQNNSTVDKV